MPSNTSASHTAHARRLALIFLAMLASLVATPRRATGQAGTGDTSRILAPTDWRREWVGRWEVEFAFDSALTGTRAGMRWRAATGRRVTGTFVITDTTSGRDDSQLLATLTMDFTALVGHEMSCRQQGSVPIRLSRQRTFVVIEFTPNVADCGFSGTVERSGRTAAGQWSETTIVGPVRLGRLRLRKQ